jgi:membrane protein implicated in regulation of membrane protease activity
MHHHTFLLLPGLALALLCFLPWPLAVPAWLAVTGMSLLAFGRAARALQLPVRTGREGMLGDWVAVLAAQPGGWWVRHEGERWSAVSTDSLRPGERGRIVGVQGLKLVIVPDDEAAPPEQRALAAERRVLRDARARLAGRAAALAALAAQREDAARRALPANEPAARAYLAQRAALMAERERLLARAAALDTELAHLGAADQEGL